MNSVPTQDQPGRIASGRTKRKPSWWKRNWKWAAPLGCGVLLTPALFVAGVVLFAFGVMKSSGAFTEAVAAAEQDSRVIEILGEPIEPGWFVSGSINIKDSSGAADLVIPLEGSRSRGKLHVRATMSGGVWTFHELRLEAPGAGRGISLLDEVEPADAQ